MSTSKDRPRKEGLAESLGQWGVLRSIAIAPSEPARDSKERTEVSLGHQPSASV